MIFNVFAIYYRFTKPRTSSTFFEIFVPNLARILLVYVLTKCWKQNFEFGPYFHKKYNSSGLLAIFWPKMSKIWLRVPKNCIFFQKSGPNSKFCFQHFVNTYTRSILAKFGTKISKNVEEV